MVKIMFTAMEGMLLPSELSANASSIRKFSTRLKQGRTSHQVRESPKPEKAIDQPLVPGHRHVASGGGFNIFGKVHASTFPNGAIIDPACNSSVLKIDEKKALKH